MKKKSYWTDSNRKKLVLESQHINLHGLDYIDDRKCWMKHILKALIKAILDENKLVQQSVCFTLTAVQVRSVSFQKLLV